MDELSEFFDFMWGNVEGYAYLPTKDSEGNWKKVFYRWPEHKKHVVDHVKSATARKTNVFFSPALYTKPDPKKEFVLGSNVIWAEFDGNAPQEWEGTDIGNPSYRVQSSTEDHQHVYWRLGEFCTDISNIENANRGIAYSYGADTSGWDANQILRPPGTINYKHNLEVSTLESNGPTYKIDDFSIFKPIKQLVNESIDDTDLPDVIDIIARYSWETDTLNLIKKSADELGGRDRSSAMMKVGFYCAEKGMEDREIYSILLTLDNKWGKFKGREDRKRRLLDIVNKAKTKYPHAVAELTFAGLDDETTKTEVGIKVVYGFEELISLQEHIDWTIKGLVAKGGIGLIASAAGIGKTQISLNLGMHSALALPFIGLQPMYRQKILYFSLEMGRVKIKEFLSTMRPAFTDEQVQILQRNFMVAPIGGTIPLHSEVGRAFFESLIDEYKPDGVYVDSLQKVLLHDLNDDEQVRVLFNYFQALVDKYGIYLVFIHHNRKGQVGNKKPVELSDVYGSQFITSEPDWVMTVARKGDDKNTLEIYNPKNRLGEMLDPFQVKRIENLQFQVEFGGLNEENGTRISESKPLGTGPSSPIQL